MKGEAEVASSGEAAGVCSPPAAVAFLPAWPAKSKPSPARPCLALRDDDRSTLR